MTPASAGGLGAAANDEAPVPSPCVNVCRMDAVSGLCEGCLRTLDEIAAWSLMADADKRAVWAALARRRAARPSSASVQRPSPPAGDTP